MTSPELAQRRSFHIGRYHCTETLSQGPLGETFRAKVYGVAGLERQYALKQIDVQLRTDPELRARLVEAAHEYAGLEHERIAKLTEIHDDGDALYFVSELARGIDLSRLLSHLRARSETLPIEQAVLIAVDVAEALDAGAHPRAGAPVWHLGLHPSAISVLGEGEVRVADFALAGPLARPGWGDEDGNVVLVAYAPPERVRAQAPAATADVWALGAVLYELCTGTALLSGTTAREIAAARVRPVAWDKLPWHPRLRELLEAFLRDDPSARPQSMAAAREQLLGIIGLELTRARAGLQAIVKRALGRTLTRTGSFAAVAIPSSGYETLAPEPTPTPAPTRGRGWAPPRATGSMQVVSPDGRPITLRGMGTSNADGEPAQMEHAELPPTSVRDTVRDQMDDIAFDDGITAPQSKVGADDPTRPYDALPPEDVRRELLASEVIELELDLDQSTTRPGPPPMPAGAATPVAAPPPGAADEIPTAPTMMALAPSSVSAHEAVTKEEPAVTAQLPGLPAAPTPTPVSRKGSGTTIVVGIALVGLAVAFFVSRENGASVKPTEMPVAKVEAPPPPVAKVEAPPPPVAKVEAPPPPAIVAGQLSIATTPPGAAAWVDGEPRGAAPLSLPLVPGRHHVVLVAPGMKVVQKTVGVEPRGETLTATLEPAKLSSELVGSGGLKVRCRTLGELRILVDGQDTGLSCPNDTRIAVTPGAHKIGLLSPRTGETKEVEGEIEDDVDHSTRVYVRY